jgi:hypothetical protein
MKKADVEIGGVYTAKVSKNLVSVRIDRVTDTGKGWFATNLRTGRTIWIRSAGRLRGVAEEAA